ELDPVPCSRPRLHLEAERLVEAHGLVDVGHEMDWTDPHRRSASSESRCSASATSTSLDSEVPWSIAACLARRISVGGRETLNCCLAVPRWREDAFGSCAATP